MSDAVSNARYCTEPIRTVNYAKLDVLGATGRQTSTQVIILNWDFAPEFMAGNITLEAVTDFKYLG